MPLPYSITWLHHIRSGSKEKFPSTRQETCSSLVHSSNFQHMDIYFSEVGRWGVEGKQGKGLWWRDEGVLSHYMYLSAHVFTCCCHLTWQVYQCPRLIRTCPSAWQAEPTALQSRLTAPQVAGGGKEGGRNQGGERQDKSHWGVKEHTHTTRGVN